MLNILIVDDSTIMRQNLKRIINDLGHNVTGEAASGNDAIFLAKEFTPDLITMDITMPEMDGIETTKILKKKYPDVKIIMTTSHGQEDMVRQSIKNGAKGYILKPVTKNKIEDIIVKLFNNKVKHAKQEEITREFSGLV